MGNIMNFLIALESESMSDTKLVSVIKSDIRDFIDNFKKNKESMKRVRNTIDSLKSHSNKTLIRLHIGYDATDMGVDGGSVKIISGDQEIVEKLNWILSWCASNIKSKYRNQIKENGLYISVDNKEGSIIIES